MQLRTPFNWLLMNLSSTELIISLTGHPFLAYNSFAGKWSFGHTFCQINALCMTYLGIIVKSKKKTFILNPNRVGLLDVAWGILGLELIYSFFFEYIAIKASVPKEYPNVGSILGIQSIVTLTVLALQRFMMVTRQVKNNQTKPKLGLTMALNKIYSRLTKKRNNLRMVGGGRFWPPSRKIAFLATFFDPIDTKKFDFSQISMSIPPILFRRLKPTVYAYVLSV